MDDYAVRELVESAYWRGWEACNADRAEEWHDMVWPVIHQEAYLAEVAARAVRSAEAACRRDAAGRWESMVAEALRLEPGQRTTVQAALAEMHQPHPGDFPGRGA